MIRGIETSGRWLLSIILMLLFSVSLTAALNVWAAVPQEIYVDDDYTEATGGWNVTHFATIQSAIDAASPGDTINVAAGTYQLDNTIVVDKSVSIIGDPVSPETVIIQAPIQDDSKKRSGDNSCFLVAAGNVTISGFTLENALDIWNELSTPSTYQQN